MLSSNYYYCYYFHFDLFYIFIFSWSLCFLSCFRCFASSCLLVCFCFFLFFYLFIYFVFILFLFCFCFWFCFVCFIFQYPCVTHVCVCVPGGGQEYGPGKLTPLVLGMLHAWIHARTRTPLANGLMAAAMRIHTNTRTHTHTLARPCQWQARQWTRAQLRPLYRLPQSTRTHIRHAHPFKRSRWLNHIKAIW